MLNLTALIQKEGIQPKQQQILDAAITCVKRWGIDRITLNDVADEAGAARSTIYTYYKSKDEIVRAALLHSAYQFGEKLFNHIVTFDTAEERLIESAMYAITTLPDEPALMLISDSTLSEMVREHSLTTPEGLDIGSAVMSAVIQDESYSKEELLEMSETAMRFMLSLLTMESPEERSELSLRAYVARRMLPAIGLSIPEKFNIYKRAL